MNSERGVPKERREKFEKRGNELFIIESKFIHESHELCGHRTTLNPFLDKPFELILCCE